MNEPDYLQLYSLTWGEGAPAILRFILGFS